MNSIRTFIISSSMFLCIWLAASYFTHMEINAPRSAAQQPVTSGVNLSAETQAEEGKETIAGVR